MYHVSMTTVLGDDDNGGGGVYDTSGEEHEVLTQIFPTDLSKLINFIHSRIRRTITIFWKPLLISLHRCLNLVTKCDMTIKNIMTTCIVAVLESNNYSAQLIVTGSSPALIHFFYDNWVCDAHIFGSVL